MGSKRALMPRRWGLMGKGPAQYRTAHPPNLRAPLYRLNHSKGLVGGTGEPREQVRCVGQRARSTPFS